MSFRGRGRGGSNHFNNSNTNRNNTQQPAPGQNGVEVEIYGWNGSTPADCIAFISRKCKITVSNYSVQNNTSPLRGFVRSEKDANDLIQWSGVRFAGNPLKINKLSSAQLGLGSTPQNSGSSTIEALTIFLKSRYNPEIKLLNLSAMQQDPTLSAKGFFGSLSTSSKFFPALMKIASDLKVDVTSLDLSNNNLSDLSSVSTAAQTFPTLQNLSLQSNKLARIQVFDLWRKKFNHLRELIINDNPVLNTADPLNVKLELMKVFPRLVILNEEIIRNEKALSETLRFSFGAPQPMFFQDNDVHNISTNFISNYINMWDGDRAGLMVLYQNESQFSLQVDSASPHTVNANAAPDFGYYLPVSRNLTRISSVKVRQSKIAMGQDQIFKMFSQIPKTHHNLLNKPEDYSMESYRVAAIGAICITLHGSYDELAPPQNMDHVTQSGPNRNKFSQNKKSKIPLGRKSFDRTLLIIPGVNNSMVVASDLLCIRAEAEATAFHPSKGVQPMVPGAVAPEQAKTVQQTPGSSPAPQQQQALGAHITPSPSTADLPAELKTSLNQVQQELLVKILIETKLTIQYGFMLCQQSNWDYQQCIANFKASAGSLPPDAFA